MEKNQKPIVMSGIRSTGFLHLGNYFGALKNYVRLQEEYECFFMVADLHSLTTHPDTKELKSNVHRVLAENIAFNKGFADPGAFAVERWMMSGGHRANILYVGFQSSAIGSYVAADGSVHLTQVFLTR